MLAEIFGPDLLIVIIIVAVVLFGGAAIPKLARSLGSAKTEFEKGIKEGGDKAQAEAKKSPEVPAPNNSTPSNSN
jgi:sec-independent protein translocase protein TatA